MSEDTNIRKNQVLSRNTIEQNEHEPGPVHARRVFVVDKSGNPVGYSSDSPLYVVLSDGSINIETLNAELRVQLSDKDNDPKAGDVHSTVRIGNGTYDLKVNPDGSINVVLTDQIAQTSIYDEVANNITSSALTPIFSFTSVDDNTHISQIEVDVSTPAMIQLVLDGVTIRQKRTSPLERTATFKFDQPRQVLSGKVLTVEAIVDRFLWSTYETFTSFEGYK